MKRRVASRPARSPRSLSLTAAGTARLPQPRDFAGKYPTARLGKLRLVDLPVVRRSLAAAVHDTTVAAWLPTTGPAAPVEYAQRLIYTSTCQPHNCGNHNWAFVWSEQTQKAAVCYHDADRMTGSRWYVDGAVRMTSPTDCGGGLLELPPGLADTLDGGPLAR